MLNLILGCSYASFSYLQYRIWILHREMLEMMCSVAMLTQIYTVVCFRIPFLSKRILLDQFRKPLYIFKKGFAVQSVIHYYCILSVGTRNYSIDFEKIIGERHLL